ncbi:MAG: phage tail protein [Gammaproteobacteria bacterium]|nr:phage tail protein [Gammaproteobacteria bacterium]
MAEPFVSEMRMFGFGWAPRGWAQCDGQSLPISQNQTLYSLLGTSFGGDGRTSFNLPDMRSRVPVHSHGSANIPLGTAGGTQSVTLTSEQLATHTHTMKATTSNGNAMTFTGNIIAAGFDNRPDKQLPVDMYGPAANLVSLNTQSVSSNGSGMSHDNMQPSTVVNFCIALSGLFPSRN